ncbi:MAG TPA: SDR family NAD(P)-dependent oxidoreductase [Solirubrobacteraceae bacterium]|nr:SDR family NAD(P)-dependent oxidoreductase [Solirubrobacteraceae bacterium]
MTEGVNQPDQRAAINPTYDFERQVAVVTGAGSGMGLATAQAFAQAGAAVVLADVNEPALREATEELANAGHRAIAVTCDVSDEDQVASMVERTVREFGRLDMAFNNAGIMVPPTDAADEPARQAVRPRPGDQPSRRLGLDETRARTESALHESRRSPGMISRWRSGS